MHAQSALDICHTQLVCMVDCALRRFMITRNDAYMITNVQLLSGMGNCNRRYTNDPRYLQRLRRSTTFV